MSEENLFEAQDPATQTTQTPAIPDNLKELIGEGKKYASVEVALAALKPAQDHIARIEDENRQMREKVAQATAAEDAYKKLMEDLERRGETTPPAPTGLDEASVAALFDRKLQEKALEDKQKANVTRVLEGMKAKFGDKAEEVYTKKAEELGVSTKFLNDLVKHSPKAAEELFGIVEKKNVSTTLPGSVNTAALNSRPREDKPQRGPLSGGNLMDAWNRAKESIKE